VIDIRQAVPILAEIGGATVPITVDIALQVSLSGPVTASVEAVATPVVEAMEPTSQPDIIDEEDNLGVIVLDDVQWRLIEMIDKGQTFDYMEEKSSDYHETTKAKFGVLHFEVKNDGRVPVDLVDYLDDAYGDYELALIDRKERIFESYFLYWSWDKNCRNIGLNPGISAECYVVFELPDDVEDMMVGFIGDTSQQAIYIPAD
jgi:hypothetical protein